MHILYHNILYMSPVVAVQLKQVSYTISEGKGTVTVCSVVSNITEQAVQVVISSQPDSAEGQLACSTVQVIVPSDECLLFIDFADFSPSQFTVTFEAGQSQCQCVQIPIVDDSIYENSEMIHVLLENITSDVTVAMGMSTVIILDNDGK